MNTLQLDVLGTLMFKNCSHLELSTLSTCSWGLILSHKDVIKAGGVFSIQKEVLENIINEKVTFTVTGLRLKLLPPFSCNHGEEDLNNWVNFQHVNT